MRSSTTGSGFTMPFRRFGDGGGEPYRQDEDLDFTPRGDEYLPERDKCWREDDASTRVRLRPRAFCMGVVRGCACALFAAASALFAAASALFAAASALFAAAAALFCSFDISYLYFLVWELMKSRAKGWCFEWSPPNFSMSHISSYASNNSSIAFSSIYLCSKYRLLKGLAQDVDLLNFFFSVDVTSVS